MQHRTKRLLIISAGSLFLLLLILYMGGFFATGLIGPEEEVSPLRQEFRPAATAIAEVKEVTDYFEAVGTVSSRTQARIAAQVMARVVAVEVEAGSNVKQGDPLVVLDDRQLRARLEQAQQGLQAALAQQNQAERGVEAAQAALDQAESQYARVQKYYQAEAATEQMLEEAESAYLQAEAGRERAEQAVEQARAAVRQARKQVEEATISLGYTTLRSPIDGEVAARLVDPGDLAAPGKPLLTLQTPEALRLEALVRESLIRKLHPGQKFKATVNALDLETEATLEEIVPAADPRSRTFVIKAALPSLPGLHPGMFGRLFIPVSQQTVVLVPQSAVRTIGQLQVVTIRQAEEWQNISVLTGKEIDGKVEILSGLAGGETVALTGGESG